MRTRALSDAQQHIEDEHIPGTDVMRDHDGIHFQRAHGGKGTVLVPQPSNRSDDPLNWNWKYKSMVAATQALYVIFTVASALSMAPMNGLAAQEWPTQSETRIGLLTGGCVLSLGYANFIIVPCSNIFGRRITAIVCAILFTVFSIWEAVAKSYGSFLAARVMVGVPTAINETMMVQVIADLFFVHERGRWMGLYFTSFFFGLFIGPIMSGNMAQKYNWRAFWWLSVGLGAFNTLNLVFCNPETRFSRNHIVRAETEQRMVHEGKQRDASTPEGTGTATPGEDKVDQSAHLEHADHMDHAGHIDAETGPGAIGSVQGHGRPSKQQWKLWQPINPEWRATLFQDLVSPWLKFFNPIILWAGATTFGSANVLLYFNLNEQLLSKPPWNFSPSSMGYANFAFIVGGLMGLSTAGPLSDWVAKKMTQRNGGIREAEFRLPALIPYIIIAIIGIVVGGLALDRRWKWEIILCVGYGATGILTSSIPTIAVAYAVDCYTPIAGDIMVVATVIKNTTGFGLSYWVFDFIARKGVFTATMIQFATCIGPAVCALPLYFFGKKIRRMTRNSNWHKV